MLEYYNSIRKYGVRCKFGELTLVREVSILERPSFLRRRWCWHRLRAATDAKIDFDSLKSGYFTAIGWDLKSGKPSRLTLIDLGPDELTDEQAHLLREALLKLNCRITIHNRAVFISGKLWVDVGAKATAS